MGPERTVILPVPPAGYSNERRSWVLHSQAGSAAVGHAATGHVADSPMRCVALSASGSGRPQDSVPEDSSGWISIRYCLYHGWYFGHANRRFHRATAHDVDIAPIHYAISGGGNRWSSGNGLRQYIGTGQPADRNAGFVFGLTWNGQYVRYCDIRRELFRRSGIRLFGSTKNWKI